MVERNDLAQPKRKERWLDFVRSDLGETLQRSVVKLNPKDAVVSLSEVILLTGKCSCTWAFRSCSMLCDRGSIGLQLASRSKSLR